VFENRMVRYFLRFIPALAETVMLGKVLWHVRQWPDAAGGFDRIVLDLPATGHALTLLGVPRSLLSALPSGPMASEAVWMQGLLTDPMVTAAVLVSLPEELPVNETLELAQALRTELQIRIGAVVLNQAVRPRFGPADLASLSGRPGLSRLAQTSEEDARRTEQALERLRAVDAPLVQLPRRCPGGGAPVSGPSLEEVLRRRRVLVCVGAGGVGKTTLAAAVAMRAAALGRSALVCTIDPARRLANALGLTWLGNAPTEVQPEVLSGAGIHLAAPLQAMMLDLKASWDDLIQQQAPPGQRERILKNRFYQTLSTVLAGSQEYIALERLGQLRERSEAELIVLDTPPTAHALDFLDAPSRILDFLDNEAARWLLDPALRASRLSLRLALWGGGVAAKTIGRIIGGDTLEELAAFLAAVSGMNERFRERARAVRALLASPETGFLLVAGASPERREEALRFHAVLGERGLQRDGVVVNRVQEEPPASADSELDGLSEPLRGTLVRTLVEARALADRDRVSVRLLREGTAPVPLVAVPRFSDEIHDLRALWRAGSYLLGEAAIL
jgi:anion-transporting  ArsA/GET3 family ATPase